MAQTETKMPVKTEKISAEPTPAMRGAWPIESLRRDVDRLFDDFSLGFWRAPFRRPLFAMEPFWSRELRRDGAPAVDIVESDKAYEVTAELPGLEAKEIDVKLVNGSLLIKGEKHEEKEEKEKEYYLHERRFGSFERCFDVPDGVDTGKIEASFNKGVLTVTLPKKPEAQKQEKKIEVKPSA
jgi:HSP20 family protein